MPDFLPEGLWGDEYRAAGGMVVPDMMAQLRAQQEAMQQTYGAMPEMPAAPEAPVEQPFDESQFVDWPTYQQVVGEKLKPHEAYDEYTTVALPWQLKQMGYTDEEIQAEVAQFGQMSPAPAADYGFLGNLWESLKSGGAAGTRAVQAAGDDVMGDVDKLAKLVVEQGTESPTAPRLAFDAARRSEANDSLYDSITSYLSAMVQEPVGFANETVYQFAQSYPVMGAALAGLLIPSPGAAPAAAGAGSFALDTGATLLGDIVEMARDRGINPNDAAAVKAMLQEPGVYEGLRETAAAHGFGVGATDAALSAISLGIGGAAARLVRQGKPLRAGGAALGGLGIGGVGGGAGEALGTRLAGGQFSPDDVVAEALGGFATDAAFEGAGAAREFARNPLRTQPPGVPPVVPPVDESVDFEEGDLPAGYEAPVAPPPRPTMVVGSEGGGAFVPTPENVAARDAFLASQAIDIPPAGEEINIEAPEQLPTYDVEEIPGRPDVEVIEPTVEEITLEPAKIIDTAEARIAEGRLLPFQPTAPLVAGAQGVGTPAQMEAQRLQGLTTPQAMDLNVRDSENVAQWFVSRGVEPTESQIAIIADLVGTPPRLRREFINDVMEDIVTSSDENAEQFANGLLAIANSLPKDPVPKPETAAAMIARDLGVTPESVVPTVIDGLAKELMVTNMEAGVTDAIEAEPASTARTVETPKQSKRGLRNGELLPDTSLAGLAHQLAGPPAVERAGRLKKQPGGNVRPGVAEEGAGPRGRSLAGRKASAAPQSQSSPRAVADDTPSDPGVPRLVRGVAYGAQETDVANEDALAAQRDAARARKATGGLSKKAKQGLSRKAKIDIVTMDAAEYEETYPGRKYDDDIEDLLDASWTTVDGEVRNPDPLTPEQLQRINGARITDLLNWMGATMRTPMQRAVAQQIERLDLPPGLRVFVTPLPGNMRGVMKRDGTIHIDPRKGTMQTLLHEAVHLATVSSLKNPRTPKQRAAAEAMNKLFKYATEQSEFTNSYGFEDVYEFTAEALANPAFQKELAAIPLPKEMQRYGLKNVLDMFKRLVMRLLGMNESDNVLSEAILTASDLFDNVAKSPVDLAERGRNAAAPSSAILGTKQGQRTYIAYAKDKNNPNTSYTLYPVNAENYRGEKGAGIPGLTREEVEKYIRDAGAQVIPPANDTSVATGTPKNTSTKLVGYSNDGDLRSVAFEQKDGTWTYYESDADVRTDPEARVTKGLSKDQVQRSISARGLAVDAPKAAAVKPDGAKPTAVGYDPATGFRRQFQDVEATLKNIGGDVDVDATMRNSRFERAWNKAKRTYVEPARKAGQDIVERFGKTQDQVEELLQNLHIAERMPVKIQQFLRGNLPQDEVAKKVKDLQEKQAAAEKFINDTRNSNAAYVQAVKQEFSPKVKAMSDNNIDLAAQYGLISRELAETIKKAYDFYVPLQTGDKTTSGKAATGANVKTDRSFARMVEQLSRTIARGEQNRVRASVLKLARENGLMNNETKQNPVHVGPSVKVRYDAETNSLNEGIDNHVFDKNSIDVYEGGERTRMTIDDESLLEALHPYTGEQRKTAIGALTAVMARVNRIISIGKTSLNPAWPPFNFARDVLTANLNMPLNVSRMRFNTELMNPATYASVLYNVAKEAFGGEPTGKYADARAAGSFISHRAYLGLDEVANDTQALFKPSLGKQAKAGASRVFDILSIWPQIAESVPRFAVYKAALGSGLTGERAGHAAKHASVNFENRGRSNLSNYWIFGNAKMQGIHALAQTYKRNGPVKAALGASAIVALGALAASLGYDLSEKDKDGKSKYAKVPDYKKDSLLLFKADGVGIPIPQEISPLYVLGNAIQEARMGGIDPGKAAARIGTSVLNNAWPGNVPQQDPVGHKANALEFMLRMALPSYVLPGFDVATNRNTFGGDVVSGKDDKLKRGIPLSEMGSPNESQLAVNAAKGLSKLTGGVVDVAPQQLKLLHNYFDPATEGFAFMRDLFGGRESKYVGDVVNPFERKFKGMATEFYDQDQFDELLAKATRAKYLAEQRGINALDPEDQVLARSAAMLAKVNSDGNNLFKGSKLLTKERRDLLNERKREMVLDGIRRYNEMRDRQVPKR